MTKEDEYVEELRDLKICGYSGLPEEDNMILEWWGEMIFNGELDEIFPKSCYSLGKFYALFQRPNYLFYMVEQKKLKLCVWVEPMFSTACVGLWVHPDHRHSKSVFRGIQLIYHTLFTMFHGILGVTKKENILTTHVKIGYNIVGKVNGLIDDQPAWIVHLPKESFNTSKLNPKGR